MKKITAAQQKFFDNAVFIAANRLLFNQLINNFSSYSLSKAITIHNGQSLSTKERDQTGNYEVYAAGGLVGYHTERLTDKPFVVIGRKGSAGKTTYAPCGGWVIDTAYYAQPNDASELDCKFLFYAISSLDFSEDIISTAIPGINRTSIYRYSIPIPPRSIQEACIHFLDAAANKSKNLPELPPPLHEQRRIVARIEELAAKVVEARGLRRQSAEEAEALLSAASHKIFTTTNKTVGEIADVTKLAGFEYTKYLTNAQPGNIKLIRAGNVRKTGLDLANTMTITEEVSNALPRSQLKPGNVVMTFIGAKIGDVTYIKDEHPRLHCGPNVAKLTPCESISTLYLVKVLQAPLVQKQIEEITKSTAQPSLSMQTIRTLKLPVPPLPEQRRIVAYLDNLQAKVDALKRLQTETAAELDALLPSILDKAFKGEL